MKRKEAARRIKRSKKEKKNNKINQFKSHIEGHRVVKKLYRKSKNPSHICPFSHEKLSHVLCTILYKKNYGTTTQYIITFSSSFI